MKRLDITVDGELIYIDIAADGFLYNMVRIIAGTLIDIANSRFAPEDTARIIESLDRSQAGFTAPPEGLCLMKVCLDSEAKSKLETLKTQNS